MVLDRLTKFSVPVSMRPVISPAGVKPLPNLPQRATKPQYDRATHTIFAAAVRDMVQSQKGINLERWAVRIPLNMYHTGDTKRSIAGFNQTNKSSNLHEQPPVYRSPYGYFV